MTRTIEDALTGERPAEPKTSSAVARAIEKIKDKEAREADNERDPDDRSK
jgi:hypothetical protein